MGWNCAFASALNDLEIISMKVILRPILRCTTLSEINLSVCGFDFSLVIATALLHVFSADRHTKCLTDILVNLTKANLVLAIHDDDYAFKLMSIFWESILVRHGDVFIHQVKKYWRTLAESNMKIKFVNLMVQTESGRLQQGELVLGVFLHNKIWKLKIYTWCTKMNKLPLIFLLSK